MSLASPSCYRVLAIDDEPEVCKLYHDILYRNDEFQGQVASLELLTGASVADRTDAMDSALVFDLDTVLSGEEGLEKVEAAKASSTPYAVIYLDMRMPGGWDGLETAKQIRKVDPLVRIILITTHLDYGLQELRQQIGMDFIFLRKPIDQNVLLQLTTLFAMQWEQAQYPQRLAFSPFDQMPASELDLLSGHDSGEDLTRIMLVDDSATVCAVYTDLLSRNPQYQVKSAANMGEALLLAEQFLPDISIIDYYMPGGNGDELTRQLLSNPVTHNTLVVIFTQKSEVEVQALEAGAMDVIYKDDPTEIFLRRVAVMQRYIQNQRSLRIHIRKSEEQRRRRERMQLKEREASLRQQWLESILQSIPDGLCVANGNGTIEQVNLALLQMSGYLQHELLGKRVETLLEDNERVAFDRSMLCCKDGSTLPVSVTRSPLSEIAAGESGDVWVFHSLSDLLNAEQIRQSSKAKDDFLAAMSHELRTPLTAIIGNSEALEMTKLNKEQQQMLQGIKTSARGQLALINDILDLSKIESGKFEIDPGEFDLCVLLDEMSQLFSVSCADRGIAFKIDKRGDFSYQLQGDGRRIGQILINLIGNAIKFTKRGSITLKCWASDQLYLQVNDSGIGMSREVKGRLFKPFEQGDQSISRRFGGTGLGLHISWTLAELMGGTIQVESEEGIGSCFTLQLPCHTGTQPSLPGCNRMVMEEDYRFSGRVLIAEDTPELQIVERRMLEGFGIDVVMANNGAEALELALSEPFDLILMDMQMPEMDGIEATALLRQAGCEMPIVALTANVMRQHRDQFEQAGSSGFLAKPIERKKLIAVLKQYLTVVDHNTKASEQISAAESVSAFLDDDLLQLFSERTAEMRRLIEEGYKKQDWVQVRNSAHTVKGSGTTFGYPELTHLGKAVCDAIDQDELGQLDTLLPTLINEMGRAIR